MAEIDGTTDRPQPRLSAPVPLTAEHDLSDFDCGEPVLNDWLRHRALKNESRFSRTYVVCEHHQVVGYFCISAGAVRSEEHTSELQSLMRISYAVFCLNKKKTLNSPVNSK